MDLAGAGRGIDLVVAVDERPSARFEAEPVERRLTQRRGDAVAKVGGDRHVIGLEGALQRAFQLALGIGGVELRLGDADPGTAARGTGTDVGSDFAVRRQGKPDQFLSRRRPPREDAGPLRCMRL